jgi:glycosyltransferase involved in cell wall biosynthesis
MSIKGKIMDIPLVSVVIPVFNGSIFLREAIDSVLNQTYKNIEIIVVDDGSTDDTQNIMRSYSNLIRGYHKKNGGTASALNFGIQKMNGDWFAWLSHDDLWTPDKIEMQMQFHNYHSYFLGSYTNWIKVDAEKKILEYHYCPSLDKSTKYRDLFLGNFIAGDTVIIHKKIFDEIGFFNEKYRVTQDYDMWLRIIHKYNLGLISEPLTYIRFHPNQDGQKFSYLEDEELKHLIVQNFESFDKKKLFADISIYNYTKFQSYANFWFANTICYHYQWPDVADNYYLKAFTISKKNIRAKLIRKIKTRRWFKIRNLIKLLYPQIIKFTQGNR